MISYRQADLLKKVEEEKNSIRWTLVFYNGPEGDSVDSHISTVHVSIFMQYILVSILSNLERSWNVSASQGIDLDSNRYGLAVDATERSIYKNSADAVGNTLRSRVPYFYKGKVAGGVLPTGAVYVTYKIRDAKFPTGSDVKFKHAGIEFYGTVESIRGDGSYTVKVNKRQEADLAENNLTNPVTLNDAEDWLQPQ